MRDPQDIRDSGVSHPTTLPLQKYVMVLTMTRMV
jgi:hypothetical protein